MFDLDKWSEIFQTLSRNKSRSLLTAFGIFWGVFMLVLLMGGAKGMRAMMESNYDGFAQNSIFFAAETTSKPYAGFRTGRTWALDEDDIAALHKQIPDADVITPCVSEWDNAKYRDKTTSVSLKGIRPDYARVENPKMARGRYLEDSDLRDYRKVCVIGKEVATKLFPDTPDPVGRYIEVMGVYYQVVGVSALESSVGIGGGPAKTSVFVPFTTLQRLLNRGRKLDFIAVTARPGHSVTALQPHIERTVKERHHVAPDDTRALFLFNCEAMFQMMQSLFSGIDILVWLIGIGTLISGSIGVSNIMMVVVKERTAEIGVRRAIGARPGNILTQILAESAVLTVVAGLTGIVAAVLILAAADAGITASRPEIAPGSFLISFSMAIASAVALSALGMLAGVAPALRALAVKPIDAIRDE